MDLFLHINPVFDIREIASDLYVFMRMYIRKLFINTDFDDFIVCSFGALRLNRSKYNTCARGGGGANDPLRRQIEEPTAPRKLKVFLTQSVVNIKLKKGICLNTGTITILNLF